MSRPEPDTAPLRGDHDPDYDYDALMVPKTNDSPPSRYLRCYRRRFLLALASSPRVSCPPGLKPLQEWYGEYESPALASNAGAHAHPHGSGHHSGQRAPTGSAAGATPGHGKDAAAPGAGGARRTGNHDRADRAEFRERSAGERIVSSPSSSSAAAAAASATGSMGDFRLAGSKPYSSPGFGMPAHHDPASSASSSNARERPWSTASSSARNSTSGQAQQSSASPANPNNGLDGLRRNIGDFVRKDGRAAEEGGWRSARETREKEQRDQRERLGLPGRPGDRDRDQRGAGRRDARPAWMDDEPSSSSPRTSGTQRRTNGTSSSAGYGEAMPAWATDGTIGGDDAGHGLLDTLEDPIAAEKARMRRQAVAQHASSSHKTADNAHGGRSIHVDSIQAWKAEMREMERKKKIAQERELRSEMGLPDVTDEEIEKKLGLKKVVPVGATAPTLTPAPPKSVFADYMLSAKDKEAATEGDNVKNGSAMFAEPNGEQDKGREGKPRSSRFARFFDASGHAHQVPHQDHTASDASQIPEPVPSQAPPPVNNLLATLLPGAVANTASSAQSQQQPREPMSSQVQSTASQAEQASMVRLMEMLRTSATGLTPPGSSMPTPAPQQMQSQLHLQNQHQPQPQRSVSYGRLPQQDEIAHEALRRAGQQLQQQQPVQQQQHYPSHMQPSFEQSTQAQLQFLQQQQLLPPQLLQAASGSVGLPFHQPQQSNASNPGVLLYPPQHQILQPHQQPLPRRQAQPAPQQKSRLASRMSGNHAQTMQSPMPMPNQPLSPGQFPLPPPTQRREFSGPLQQNVGLPNGLVSPLPGFPINTRSPPFSGPANMPLPPPTSGNNATTPMSDQQEAQMASFLAAQLRLPSQPQHHQQFHSHPPSIPQQYQPYHVDLKALLSGSKGNLPGR